MDNKKNYITLTGYNRLKEELHNLLTKERTELVKTIAWAASNGDRSENADYIYGKRKLREVDKKIYSLNKKLENAEVVDPTIHAGREQIFFGATVTILRNAVEEQCVKIVGQDEVDPLLNHISWNAPLGRMLLKKMVGDSFTLNLPHGSDLIEIIDVVYE